MISPIEDIITVRLLPKSDEFNEHVLALRAELYYENSVSRREYSRDEAFRIFHRHLREGGQYDFFSPGPRLSPTRSGADMPETLEERTHYQELSKDFRFVQFTIARNFAPEHLVLPLYENVAKAFDELGIQEIAHYGVPPESIKESEIYQRRGGYEAYRLSLLHPDLQERSLRDSLLKSYQGINGTLPHDAPLFDILKDYSRIIYSRIISNMRSNLPSS